MKVMTIYSVRTRARKGISGDCFPKVSHNSQASALFYKLGHFFAQILPERLALFSASIYPAFFYYTDYVLLIPFITIHRIIVLACCDIRRGGRASGGVGSAKVSS